MEMIQLRLYQLHVLFLPLCAVAVVSVYDLSRPTSRFSPVDAPRLDQPAVVMDAHIALTQPSVERTLGIPAPEETCASRICECLVRLNNHGEVQLDALRWDRLDRREQAMAVRPITNRTRRHAAEADLEHQIELTVWFEARVEEIRGVGEASCTAIRGIALAKESLHNVHDAPKQVRAAGDGGGADGAENGSSRDADVKEVVEAVVDDAVRVVDGQEVVADEDFEHGFAEIEVHGRVGLW
jgi:hypothetical protein